MTCEQKHDIDHSDGRTDEWMSGWRDKRMDGSSTTTTTKTIAEIPPSSTDGVGLRD